MKSKKTLSLILAALTVLSVATAAFAASRTAVLGTTSIVIGGSTDETGTTSSGESSGGSQSTTVTGTIVNCSEWVSLRKSASSSSSRIAKLNKGVSVTILEMGSSYHKVSYNGTEGYVSAQYVQLSSGTTAPAGTAAAAGTGTTTGNVNFRTKASTSSSKVSGCNQVPKGATVEILATSGSWYQVRYNGYTGYLHASYVTPASAAGSTAGSTAGNSSAPATGTGTIVNCSSGVNFRTGASSSYAQVSGCKQIPKGATVEILATSGSWYQVRYNGYTGYVSGDYVQLGGTAGTGSTGSTGSAGTTGTGTSGTKRYAKYTGTDSDVWGTIKVAGTNINQKIYCNALKSNGDYYYNAYSSSKNYVFSMNYLGDSIASITGHNMRVSQTGLHALHHVQNAYLGKSKCEYSSCKADCSKCKISIFDIAFDGYTQWQLVCFYELDYDTLSSTSARLAHLKYTAMNPGASKEQWLESQFSYANSKYRGAKVANATANDKLMVITSCADIYNSANDYRRLYMVLKAVG